MTDASDRPGQEPVASAARSLEIRTTPDECMENLVQKLHLLDYQKGFCETKYGSPGRSQSEQFYCFINLAAWLLHDYAGAAIKPLKEGGDAAATISQVLSALRQQQFAVPAALTAAKLQNGFGREVCGVLDGLVDLALERAGLRFKPHRHQQADAEEGDVELAEVCEAADMLVDVDQPANDEDDTSDSLDMLEGLQATKAGSAQAEQALDDSALVESAISREQWELEYQQVAPQLQIRLAAEARDWRMNLEGASRDQALMEGSWQAAHAALHRVAADVADHLRKVDTRERFLNDDFASRTDEYRNKKEVFAQKQEAYEKQEMEVNDTVSELQKCEEQIEDMTGELEERSSVRADGGPTSKVRNAVKDLEEELKQMDLQMGVIRHQLLSVRLKERLQVGGIHVQ